MLPGAPRLEVRFLEVQYFGGRGSSLPGVSDFLTLPPIYPKGLKLPKPSLGWRLSHPSNAYHLSVLDLSHALLVLNCYQSHQSCRLKRLGRSDSRCLIARPRSHFVCPRVESSRVEFLDDAFSGISEGFLEQVFDNLAQRSLVIPGTVWPMN